jgi:hypothetical protein
MDSHREKTLTSIDQYYDQMIRKLEEKRESMKDNYKNIEQREK